MFGFSFGKPQSPRDWRSFGMFSAFIVALFAGDDVALPLQRRASQAGPAVVSAFAAGASLRLPHTDWLFHRLVAKGPAATVAAFRAAACGAGTIPWRLDGDSLEEDWFHLLVNPAHRALSLAGARVLAGRLLEAVEHRRAVAVARVGHSRASPLDLHALVPRVSAKSDGRNDRRPTSAQCPQ